MTVLLPVMVSQNKDGGLKISQMTNTLDEHDRLSTNNRFNLTTLKNKSSAKGSK